MVTGASVWVTVETAGVTVLVAAASVLVAVETTGSAVLVTDPSVPPALDVAWVTVLLTCASPLAVCLAAGVLVPATGESAWAAGLTTGVTVFVTGASACPAAGCAEAVDVGTVAELPLPAEESLLAPEGWVSVGDCPVVALEPPVVDEPLPWEPLLEVPPCWPKFTTEVAEETGFVAALTAESTDERAEDGADPRGDRVSRVDACACLENSIMTTKIPAATIASCIARRATRRAIGCGMSSSHSPEPEDVARVLPAFCGSMPRARG